MPIRRRGAVSPVRCVAQCGAREQGHNLLYALFLTFIALLWVASAAWSEAASALPAADKPIGATVSPAEPDALRPYFFVGNVNNHPQLKIAEKSIDKQVNKSLRALAPGFDDVATFSDESDAFRIWTPFVGIGRPLDEHWDLFIQAGYTQGKIRTRATNLSWLLLPLRTDVTFERSSFYAGVGLGYYPWGMAKTQVFESWKERFRGARPFVATTLNWNYLTFDGDVKARFKPFNHGVTIKDHRDWRAFGAGITAGVDVPLNANSVASFNVQYNRFLEYSDDFSGPAVNFYWKRYF